VLDGPVYSVRILVIESDHQTIQNRRGTKMKLNGQCLYIYFAQPREVYWGVFNPETIHFANDRV